ncbi:gluconeogenesis factor YvcK family protein [Phocicoccus pinnipedialis]|uniref:Gluconeogenesis factor n=1 Tax=Phocicoccus pinnipedialis TaxID=110845 RepID=A0A6V7R377_9BACL|nr:uridine diphosphate-N-acetylglucosamine-binding protein YvcK [Jeotgalicoccus pinnipedialis]MBP1938799.1 putative cofD-like protein [Jeotgalicoccus pinnipedialis]CAD2071585.1 Gluconeogenesis factor [Jeotgalicoccus pinnipedialis]
MKKIKVVLVGGGTGLSVLARGLKQYPINISAIVTVADDGGSTGLIREQIDMPAPGDIRNVLSALSESEETLERLFEFRFSKNEISGHSLGNLMIAAMFDMTKDFSQAVRQLSKILNVRGEVIPSTNESPKLAAVMDDNSIYVGESYIPKADKNIKKMLLLPMDLQGSPHAIEAIEAADYIVFGPGSLYTSIIPNVLPTGVKSALQNATAKSIYICNIMQQPGETMGMSACDHVDALHAHIGKEIIDFIIMSQLELTDEETARYTAEGIDFVVCDQESLNRRGIKLHTSKELLEVSEEGVIRHNNEILAKVVYDLMLDETDALTYKE